MRCLTLLKPPHPSGRGKGAGQLGLCTVTPFWSSSYTLVMQMQRLISSPVKPMLRQYCRTNLSLHKGYFLSGAFSFLLKGIVD